MEGTIRTFGEKTQKLVKKRIEEICLGVSQAMGCKVECRQDDLYPAVVNHKTETDHVIRMAKTWFGEEHFC